VTDQTQDGPTPPLPASGRFPDTQAALAFCIVFGTLGLIVLVIFHPPPQEVASTIFTLIGGFGTLAAGVGGYFFGSSKGSVAKDDARDATMNTLVNKVVGSGTGSGGTPAAVTAAAIAAAPAAAAQAAPPAADVAAPPAAEIAVEHALAERDAEHKT
jgi:hypothetical protein